MQHALYKWLIIIIIIVVVVVVVVAVVVVVVVAVVVVVVVIIIIIIIIIIVNEEMYMYSYFWFEHESVLFVCLFLHISYILLSTVSAKGFDYDGLYVHFFLDLPQSKQDQNNCLIYILFIIFISSKWTEFQSDSLFFFFEQGVFLAY